MSIFEDISLEWKGETFTIPSKRVMKAIAVVESEVTLGELWQQQAEGKVKLTQLSAAFGKLLRFAGAKVEDEEVYEGMFGRVDDKVSAVNALNTLLALVIPPSAMKGESLEDKDTPQGNGEAGAPAS